MVEESPWNLGMKTQLTNELVSPGIFTAHPPQNDGKGRLLLFLLVISAYIFSGKLAVKSPGRVLFIEIHTMFGSKKPCDKTRGVIVVS